MILFTIGTPHHPPMAVFHSIRGEMAKFDEMMKILKFQKGRKLEN